VAVFLKQEDGKELRGADNIMLEKIPCELYKKGAVLELREGNINKTLVPRKCEMCHKKV
jgi:hypothetical protein